MKLYKLIKLVPQVRQNLEINNSYFQVLVDISLILAEFNLRSKKPFWGSIIIIIIMIIMNIIQVKQ